MEVRFFLAAFKGLPGCMHLEFYDIRGAQIAIHSVLVRENKK